MIELCPVGALTSTQYRFEARPWEIQNVPTVCGHVPRRLQHVNATAREGKVKRILSRNHPEVDGGWLCDKGRFTYPHLRAEDRITEPLVRGQLGLEPVSWDAALDQAERLLRGAGTRIVTALSGSETIEQAYALARLLRGGLGAHAAVLPESTSDALDAFRLPLSQSPRAEIVVIVGDDAGRRSCARRRPLAPQGAAERRRDRPTAHRRRADRTRRRSGCSPRSHRAGQRAGSDCARRIARSSSGAGPGGGGARVAEAAHSLGFDEKPGCGAFHLPATPNGRGVATAWAAAADEDESDPEPIGLLVVVGDDAAGFAERSRARRAGRSRDRGHDVPRDSPAAGPTSSCRRPPRSSATARCSTSKGACNGCAARWSRRCPTSSPGSRSSPGRFDVDLSPHAAVLFEEISARCFGGAIRQLTAQGPARRGRRTRRPRRRGLRRPTPKPRPDEHFLGELRLIRYRPLFSGPQVERVDELAVPAAAAELELAAADAEKRQIANGDTVVVRSNGTSVELRARINRKLVEVAGVGMRGSPDEARG